MIISENFGTIRPVVLESHFELPTVFAEYANLSLVGCLCIEVALTERLSQRSDEVLKLLP